MKYNFQNHEEVPGYIRAYISEVARGRDYRDVDVQSINDFMNGIQEWDNDPALSYQKR